MAIDWTTVTDWESLIAVMPQCGISQSECDRLAETIRSAVEDWEAPYEYITTSDLDVAGDYFLLSNERSGWSFLLFKDAMRRIYEESFQNFVTMMGVYYPSIPVYSFADANDIPHDTPEALDAARAFLRVFIDQINAKMVNLSQVITVGLYEIEAPFGLTMYVPAFGLAL